MALKHFAIRWNHLARHEAAISDRWSGMSDPILTQPLDAGFGNRSRLRSAGPAVQRRERRRRPVGVP